MFTDRLDLPNCVCRSEGRSRSRTLPKTRLDTLEILYFKELGKKFMKSNRSRFVGETLAIGILILGLFCGVYAQKSPDEKLTAEGLLAKHLESIGPAGDRNAIQSIVIVGSSKAVFHGRGGGVAQGLAVLASEGDKYMVAMKFDIADYPFEKMGFDGSEFSVGFVRPGLRTNFGSFLRTNENAFKTGIMSGVLSDAWVLNNFDASKAKLKYSGTRKIEGVKLHTLEYIPKKSSELNITLFFDPETYRHVRTEYKRVIAARQGANVDASAGMSETRYKMVEEFGDFKEENKLTLPHSYKIFLEILSGNGTTSYEWEMNLQRFTFNQDVDDKEFKVDSY